jgi:hypothetical protein
MKGRRLSPLSWAANIFPGVENSVLEPDDLWYALRWQMLLPAKHENMLISVKAISSLSWHSPITFFYKISLHWKNCCMFPLYEMSLVHISVSPRDCHITGNRPKLCIFVYHYLRTRSVLLLSAVWKHKHLLTSYYTNDKISAAVLPDV